MCGIAGRFGPALDEHESRLRFATAQRWLKHRGPNGEGQWQERHGANDVALLHARLAIIDLTPAGSQPYASDDGRVQLTFNGEIYNYRELRQELRDLGARFRSQSDTEVLLRAYERWGTDCLRRLRGMFAFAIWDGHRQELFAARDRFGIKPFFYALHSGALAFASELRPIFAMEPVPRTVSLSALDDFLTYLYVPPPNTIYEHVKELAPAHMMIARAGEQGVTIETRRYWTPPQQRLVVREQEAAELIRHELETVIRQHVLSDVPLGAFLSGGLDSTTIVALMARQSSRPIRTFCMTFGPEETHYDERKYADLVAKQYNTEHTTIPVRPDVSALLPQLVRHFGQPFGNPTALLVSELSAETRKHVTVALAGDGGDEVFMGYPRYLGLRLQAQYQRAPEALRRIIGQGADLVIADSLRGRHTLRRVREFLSTGTVPSDEAYLSWVAYYHSLDRQHLLSADVRAKLGNHASEDWLLGLMRDTGRDDPAERAAQTDLASFLPANILAYSDRMSMMHSLEMRVPFCDHILVELLLSLAPDMKMPGRKYKAMLLKSCGDLMPKAITTRSKLGFNPPMARWLNGPLRSMVDGILDRADPVMSEFFQPEGIRDVVQEHRSGRRDRSLHIWSLLVFRAWHDADRADGLELSRMRSDANVPTTLHAVGAA